MKIINHSYHGVYYRFTVDQFDMPTFYTTKNTPYVKQPEPNSLPWEAFSHWWMAMHFRAREEAPGERVAVHMKKARRR